MSEPKIGEFLSNFDVQVSSGSLSNILTKTAADFEQEYHDLLVAGLNSTPYQQTDDTSARVKGSFWNTHVLCNPFYSVYSTRPGKDRLTVLKALQNKDELRFRFDEQTLALLRETFSIPKKWLAEIEALVEALGEIECSETTLRLLLDGWFGSRNGQVRTSIEQAAAIRFYRRQDEVPVVETLVCDDAGQFKLLTEKLALCWIHEGRHYEKLSPVVPRHREALEEVPGQFLGLLRLVARVPRWPDRRTCFAVATGVRRAIFNQDELRRIERSDRQDSVETRGVTYCPIDSSGTASQQRLRVRCSRECAPT